jgi:hypothetical protein
MPFVASRDIATSNRSGAIRESRTASLLKEGRLRKQYPAHIAAPVLQLRDAVPELAAVARAGAVRNRRTGTGPVEGAVLSNPKSRELLLVLRCFRLWEVYQGGQQQQTPTLLQLLLFGGMQGDEEGVVEVVDLAGDSEGEQQQRGPGAAAASDTDSMSDTDSLSYWWAGSHAASGPQ